MKKRIVKWLKRNRDVITELAVGFIVIVVFIVIWAAGWMGTVWVVVQMLRWMGVLK